MNHYRLRRLELLARLKLPIKVKRIDSHKQAGRMELIHLYASCEAAAIYEINAVHIPVLLRCAI
ncbi:hypothetical protein D3C78_970020 [compost metagenome]